MQEHGLRWHLMREIEERGAEAVIDDAIAEALDGPDAVYISVDIDVIDPGLAPGTGTPEPGGLLPRELLRAVRRIAGAVEVAGMDIVEVSPPYDHAEVTAMAANRVALELISALAAKRQAGHRSGSSAAPAPRPARARAPTARGDTRPVTETAAEALARLYDLDLVRGPGRPRPAARARGAGRRPGPRARRAGRAGSPSRSPAAGHDVTGRGPRPGDARPGPRAPPTPPGPRWPAASAS